MKSNTLRTLIALSAFIAATALADEARVTAYTTQLRSVRVTEIARETAKIVTAEKSAARIAASADAVSAAIALNSPSTPLVVGAVAKAAPETAAIAAATAVKAQPKFASAITKAAVSAAPSRVEEIVGAMCKAQPASFYTIGVVAADVAPKSSDKVLSAIVTALPALKPLVARSQADFVAAKRTSSVALVLKHTENILASISLDAKSSPDVLLVKESDTTMATKLESAAVVGPPPVILPPFVGAGGPTPGEFNQGSSTVTPTSGRVYSGP